jgi:hypothetical protein
MNEYWVEGDRPVAVKVSVFAGSVASVTEVGAVMRGV